jgi:hypothetical protein
MSEQSPANEQESPNPISRVEPRIETRKLKCSSGRVADLTGTGMRLLVSSSNKPEIGDVQTYTFKDKNHTVEVTGTVRWVADGHGLTRKCQVGIEFTDISPQIREALMRLAIHGNLGEPGKEINEVQIKYPDLYKLLGVTQYATEDEIRRAYHIEARRWHPDLNKSAAATDHFETLTKAYEVLRDPEMRLRYDQRFGDERAA